MSHVVTRKESKRYGLIAGQIVSDEDFAAALAAFQPKPLNIYDGPGITVEVMEDVNPGAQLRKGEKYHAVKDYDGCWLICRDKSRTTVVCTCDAEKLAAKGFFVMTKRTTSAAQAEASKKWTKANRVGQVCVSFFESDRETWEAIQEAAEAEGASVTAWSKKALRDAARSWERGRK